VLGQAVAVQVVVLNLEVLAEGDEDGQGELVGRLVGDAALRRQLYPEERMDKLTIRMARATGR